MAAVSSRKILGWSLVRREITSGGDGFFAGPPALAPPATAGQQEQPGPGPSAMAARITPAVLFITVVLAVVLLVSGLLHILRRLFLKSHRANARAEAMERQLQQLFHLHEDGPGLDQAAIDALPCFAYGELELSLGADDAKEGEGDEEKDYKKKKGTRPFDCAVCLCEFAAAEDRLRLLPLCGHAFHVACIDTWLRSSSTCPLCRTQALSASAQAPPTADTDTPSVLETPTGVEEQQKQDDDASKENAFFPGSVVLPVRLGRFKNVQDGVQESSGSSRRLDARRCYSMGSNYRYVLAEENLVVSVRWRPGDSTSGAAPAGGVAAAAAARRSEQQGKKVCAASRGDSFSVSKIWQWRGSGRRLPALRADGSESPAPDDGLPWAQAQAPARTRSARQEIDT